MSLSTDSIFVAAISGNSNLMQRIGNRLYSTSIPLPDENAENVDVPFVVVTFDGLNNDQTSKDDPYESDNDQVNIGIGVTASSREALADLTQAIRETIHAYMLAQEEGPVWNYAFSAEPVQYDSWKPCYWQVLRYQCDVTNEFKEQ